MVAVTTREGHFKDRVLDRAAVQNGERVLDLACGTGTLALEVLERAAGRPRDRASTPTRRSSSGPAAKAEKAGAEVAFDEALSTELPYGDESFDVVLSTLFFHHLSDEAKRETADEINRVLRPGGRVVVADWGRPQDPLMRAAFVPVQLLDGFANTGGNVAGSAAGRPGRRRARPRRGGRPHPHTARDHRGADGKTALAALCAASHKPSRRRAMIRG